MTCKSIVGQIWNNIFDGGKKWTFFERKTIFQYRMESKGHSAGM